MFGIKKNATDCSFFLLEKYGDSHVEATAERDAFEPAKQNGPAQDAFASVGPGVRRRNARCLAATGETLNQQANRFESLHSKAETTLTPRLHGIMPCPRRPSIGNKLSTGSCAWTLQMLCLPDNDLARSIGCGGRKMGSLGRRQGTYA
jgi:hypothetical protein